MTTVPQAAYLAYLCHPERDIHVQFTWSDDLNTVAITFYENGRAIGHDGMPRAAAKDLWAQLTTEGYTRDETC